MSEKQENVFHIAFWTKDHPQEAGAVPAGWMSAVKVTIEMDVLPPEHGDLAEKYNVALAAHPLYKFLRRYVIANKG
ncbi:hypothetical protein [Azohydromonas lata]|uniref:hypothetical protein n=1 Tax=Azohydromonas lata TaxID=45677 RepID=UPI00082C1785|nr:hypothetical protein [Azohydromonas lata]